MKITKAGITALLLLSLFAGCGKTAEPPAPQPVPGEPGTLAVTFDYERQGGVASNQFAVWIEDLEGSMVKTLYATNFTAAGGYKKRPDSLAVWVSRALGVSDFDAVAGATPKSGPQVYIWDCADVSAGVYRFFVEGTLRFQDYTLYSGEVEIGGAASLVEAVPLDGSTKQTMICNVKAEYFSKP